MKACGCRDDVERKEKMEELSREWLKARRFSHCVQIVNAKLLEKS